MTPRVYEHDIYLSTDHLLRLIGLRDAAGLYQDGATVQVTLYAPDGTEVAGQTWPVTMGSIRGSGSITAVSTADDSVTVGGDHTDEILPGDRVVIEGSTGNNGEYTVAEVSLTDAGDTVVAMEQSITDSTAEGSLEWGHGSYHATLEDGLELSEDTVYEGEITADAGNDVIATFRVRAEAGYNYLGDN